MTHVTIIKVNMYSNNNIYSRKAPAKLFLKVNYDKFGHKLEVKSFIGISTMSLDKFEKKFDSLLILVSSLGLICSFINKYYGKLHLSFSNSIFYSSLLVSVN